VGERNGRRIPTALGCGKLSCPTAARTLLGALAPRICTDTSPDGTTLYVDLHRRDPNPRGSLQNRPRLHRPTGGRS